MLLSSLQTTKQYDNRLPPSLRAAQRRGNPFQGWLQRQDSGFTLIELLVVLLIIAIITAIAVLSFHDFGGARRTKLIFQKIQWVVSAAQDRALLQPAVLGLVVTNKGYVFYRYVQNDRLGIKKWLRLKEDTLSDPSAFSYFPNWKITVAKHSLTDWPGHIQPIIVFLPDGEFTPFRLTVTDLHGQVAKERNLGRLGLWVEKNKMALL